MTSEEQLIKVCEDRLQQGKEARRPYESDWFLNLAFYEGQQWLSYDGNKLFRPNIPAGRLTLTDNRIQPIIRAEVGKLMKARPGWTALPGDTDDRSIQHAQTGERLIDAAYDQLGFAAHRREGLLWPRICSAGFTKVTWDQTLGDSTSVLVRQDGEPIRDPATKRVARPGDMPEIEDMPGVAKKVVAQGDVRLDTRSPFDIYPDPLATGMHDLRWLIDESVRSPEYVADRYGKQVPVDAPANVGIVQARLGSAGTGRHVGVRVYEMWEAPRGDQPGRHVVWAGGQILLDEANPYGCIPYAMWMGVPVPGRFWPDAVVTQLRPIQARRNKLLSQLAENAVRMGNPTLFVDSMSNINMHGRIGEVVKYQAGLGEKPFYLNPPALGQHVYQLLAETENSMREVSGRYEVSQGTVPSGVTAASAISLLQEGVDTFIGPDVEAMETTLSHVGQMVLRLMARYYSTPRMVVIVGEDGIVDIDSFRSEAGFKVPTIKVRAGSTFPRSLAGKQAAIRDTLNLMLQYGVPITPDALSRTLRDMQVGGLEKIVGSFTADQQAVAREHVDFLAGKPLKRNPLIDNDEIHLAGHKDFAKTPRFQAESPARQKALLDHIEETEKALAEKAQKALALQAPADGGGGAPTPPPGLPMPPPDAIPTEASGNPAPMLDDADLLGAFDPGITV